MKKLILLFIFIAVSFSISAQSIFFPTKEGTTLVYANLNNKGKVDSHIKQRVVHVEGSGSNFSISYLSQMLDKNFRQIPEYPMEVPYNVSIVDGTLVMDMKTFAAPGTDGFIEIEGNKLKIPSTLAPGVKLDDVNFILTLNMGFKIKTEVLLTEQRCLAIEDVTVPAGNFKCYKLTQTSKAKVMGKTVVTTIVSWYTNGIGTVKTETYNHKDKLQSSMELIEVNNE